ncbi:basal cell adhesion molecule isoform X2 [Sus scrofa]|uniref:basal cell adhesion molecule isoform X2 n=1 Tax=Sus scrofa TaxID=9823 RepID=UPI0006B1600C|nr:basal cell adhesion molecule isoform X2 [Sus scrofa]
MEPPDARAPRLLVLALLLGAHPGAEAEVRLSVPPLVEVMRGEPVTLDCTPLGTHDHFVLEWFLADRTGVRHRLASAELQGSELQDKMHDSWGRSPPYQLDSQGRLVLAEAQVGDERDYVCVVRAGAAGTAEATARLNVFAKPEATEVSPNKGTLSVMEDIAQEIATCNSRNGNPVPQITWYRNGQRLEVPLEVNSEGYMTSRTVREASGLLSLTSTLYLRLRKADRDASFHCSVHYRLPTGRHGRLDSPAFRLTLHYPTEHVQFWLGSPSTTAGWVREGDSVQLFCRGDGSPTPEYTFFRLQDQEEDVLKTNLEGNLTLEGVQRSQSGTYGCRVEDYDAAEDAELSKTLELHVAYLDPLELSTGEELSLPLGNSTAVNCSVRGLPTPTLRWTKDSVPLGDDSTLSLRSITFDSAGTYTCEASMPTVPLLSRTRSFKLLVQASGASPRRPGLGEQLPDPEGDQCLEPRRRLLRGLQPPRERPARLPLRHRGPPDLPGRSGGHGRGCQRGPPAPRRCCFLLHETQGTPLLPARGKGVPASWGARTEPLGVRGAGADGPSHGGCLWRSQAWEWGLRR